VDEKRRAAGLPQQQQAQEKGKLGRGKRYGNGERECKGCVIAVRGWTPWGDWEKEGGKGLKGLLYIEKFSLKCPEWSCSVTVSCVLYVM